MSVALLALVGAALAVLAGSLPALLVAQFALGVAARLSQVASTLADTRGPVAARSEGTASALLAATRQCGSAFGVAIVSATLVVVHGSDAHRTATAMFVAAGFALAGLLATRVVPPARPTPTRRNRSICSTVTPAGSPDRHECERLATRVRRFGALRLGAAGEVE